MIRFIRGKIKIVSIPAGEAPVSVRKKWVGLELPVIAIRNTGCRGALTKKGGPKEVVYYVDQTAAIEILMQAHPDAVVWWNDHSYPKRENVFCFKKDEVEEIGHLKKVRLGVVAFFGILEEGGGAVDDARNMTGSSN